MGKLFFGSILITSLLLAIAVSPAVAGEHAYIGNKNCKKCHIKQWKSWSETKMSQAYETLQPGIDAERKAEMGLDAEKDYTTDEECVACHVTGWGEEGGFTSIGDTPELASIGCEMCHGPGGTYTQDEYMSLKNKEYKKADVVAVGLVDTVSEEQCVRCHNENVPIEGYTFDFATKKGEGTHESFPLKYEH
jgi:hypothetical protein